MPIDFTENPIQAALIGSMEGAGVQPRGYKADILRIKDITLAHLVSASPSNGARGAPSIEEGCVGLQLSYFPLKYSQHGRKGGQISMKRLLQEMAWVASQLLQSSCGRRSDSDTSTTTGSPSSHRSPTTHLLGFPYPDWSSQDDSIISQLASPLREAFFDPAEPLDWEDFKTLCHETSPASGVDALASTPQGRQELERISKWQSCFFAWQTQQTSPERTPTVRSKGCWRQHFKPREGGDQMCPCCLRLLAAKTFQISEGRISDVLAKRWVPRYAPRSPEAVKEFYRRVARLDSLYTLSLPLSLGF